MWWTNPRTLALWPRTSLLLCGGYAFTLLAVGGSCFFLLSSSFFGVVLHPFFVLFLGGAAWPHPFGGVAFSLSLVGGAPLSSSFRVVLLPVLFLKKKIKMSEVGFNTRN